MSNKLKAVSNVSGRNGGYIRSYIVPEGKRIDPDRLDGIRLEIKSPNLKYPNNLLFVDIKNWEALSIIEVLSLALLEKQYPVLELKGQKEEQVK